MGIALGLLLNGKDVHLRSYSTLFNQIMTIDSAVLTEGYKQRFSNVARLYKGDKSLYLLKNSHCCVVGLGGVGSWTVEALARSGIGELTLIDVVGLFDIASKSDDICISNTNRQLQALTSSIGKFKAEVLRNRVLDINPECVVHTRLEFLTAENVDETIFKNESTVPEGVFGCYDFVIDATDGVTDKAAIIDSCVRSSTPIVVCGGAGNIVDPTLVRVSDMTQVLGDGLVLYVRKKLRQKYGYPKGEQMKAGRKADRSWNIPVVHSKFIPQGSTNEKEEEEASSAASSSSGAACTVTTFRTCDSLGTACFATGAVGFALASVAVSSLALGRSGSSAPFALGRVGACRPSKIGRLRGLSLSKGFTEASGGEGGLVGTGNAGEEEEQIADINALVPTPPETAEVDPVTFVSIEGADEQGVPYVKQPYAQSSSSSSSLSSIADGLLAAEDDVEDEEEEEDCACGSFTYGTPCSSTPSTVTNDQIKTTQPTTSPARAAIALDTASLSGGGGLSAVISAVDAVGGRWPEKRVDLVDSHCHLQLEPLFTRSVVVLRPDEASRVVPPHIEAGDSDTDAVSVISRARAAGVIGAVVCAVCPGEDWQRLQLLLSSNPDFVMPQFGLHPWWILRYFAGEGLGPDGDGENGSRMGNENGKAESALDSLQSLRGLLLDVLTRFPSAGVGECGLDKPIASKKPTGCSMSTQIDVLRVHIQVAAELSRPLTLHCVQCWGTLIDTLADEARAYGGRLPPAIILHSCNAMPLEMVPRFQALSSASGTRVFYSVNIKTCGPKEMNLVRSVPHDRLLIETDSPDQLPREFVGRIPCNEPAMLAYGALKLADALGFDFEEFAARVASNTRLAYSAERSVHHGDGEEARGRVQEEELKGDA